MKINGCRLNSYSVADVWLPEENNKPLALNLLLWKRKTTLLPTLPQHMRTHRGKQTKKLKNIHKEVNYD